MFISIISEIYNLWYLKLVKFKTKMIYFEVSLKVSGPIYQYGLRAQMDQLHGSFYTNSPYCHRWSIYFQK